MNETRAARPSEDALSAATSSAGAADVGADARRQRQLGQQRQEEAARAGADIENADRPLAPALARRDVERRPDERFGIGTRIERRRRQRKRAPVELTPAENAGDRLARTTPRHHRLETVLLVG